MREIGSDFAWEPPMGASQRPPWEGDLAAHYFQTGRQALARVDHELFGLGVRTIFIAPPFCDSMVAPFRLLSTEFVADVDEHVVNAAPADSAVFVQTLFGALPSSEFLTALEAARRRGVRVLVDFTHAPFTWDPKLADFSVASLRKLLPLSDGAVALGLTGQGLQPSSTPDVAVTTKISAMHRKKENLDKATGAKDHLMEFAAGEDLIGAALDPQPISAEAEQWIQSADFDALAQARERNSERLAMLLTEAGIQVVNAPQVRVLPSHLVIRTPHRDQLRRELVGHAVYCPIHWVKPSSWTAEWPEDTLSIPIDHRYDLRDMERIAIAVTAVMKGLD